MGSRTGIWTPGSRTPDSGHDTAETALTALEAARRLGINERTIRRAITRGELPATKQHGQFRIAADALHRYQQQRRGPAAFPDDRAEPRMARPFQPGVATPTLLVVGPGLPLRPAFPHPLDPLIGRERELGELQGLLSPSGARLVTLTGPGGVGKSRLALAAAAAVEQEFTGGVAFVPLASISDPNLILPTIARALGLLDAGDRPIAEGLGTVLRQRELLLVIDNVEQVVTGSPALADLLAACPKLRILATSREPLRVSGEVRFPISPLPSRPPRNGNGPRRLPHLPA